MSDSIQLEFPGGILTVRKRKWYPGDRSSDMNKAPRLYVNVTDESVFENLENRKRRPYNVYKTLIHSSGLRTLINIDKLSWSQHAGCTCACSPGFVLGHQNVYIGDETFYNWDAWVTLTNAPAVDPAKPARVLELI